MTARPCRYEGCGQPIILVRVTGRSKPVPLDAEPGPGVVAAYKNGAGAWVGRVLATGEQPEGVERRYAIHECDGAKREGQRGDWTAAVSAHAKQQRRRRSGPRRQAEGPGQVRVWPGGER